MISLTIDGHKVETVEGSSILEAAREHGISHIIAASTKGDTARVALDAVKKTSLKLVVVTHSTGFSQPGVQEFDPAVRNSR